jgi:outer membrane protein OmpA-like peptidoglycan-associated protein
MPLLTAFRSRTEARGRGRRSGVAGLAVMALVAATLPFGATVQAAGGTGTYASWTAPSGTPPTTLGSFTSTSFPNVTAEAQPASGDRRAATISVASSATLSSNTPFGARFGSSLRKQYLNIGGSISSTNTAEVVLTFASPAPAGSWAFALGDVDAEEVAISATASNGTTPLTEDQLGWRGAFNYANIPVLPEWTWNAGTSTGTLKGSGNNTDGESGWFAPTVPVKSVTLTQKSLTGFPSYQLWIATDDTPPPPVPSPPPPPEPEPEPTPTPTPPPPPEPTVDEVFINEEIQQLPAGQALVFEGSTPVQVQVVTNPTQQVQTIQGSTWALDLTALAPNGKPTLLTADGAVDVTAGGELALTGSGLTPGSVVNVFLIDPTQSLGSFIVGPDGTFSAMIPVPPGLAAGRYVVQANGTTPAGQVRSTSVGLLVNNRQPRIGTLKATVYFDVRSAVLDEKAKRTLARLARKVPNEASVTRIRSVGFVQPESFTANDQRLSTKRARNVVRQLRKDGVRGPTVIRGNGQAKQSGAKARRATVTVTYQIYQ